MLADESAARIGDVTDQDASIGNTPRSDLPQGRLPSIVGLAGLALLLGVLFVIGPTSLPRRSWLRLRRRIFCIRSGLIREEISIYGRRGCEDTTPCLEAQSAHIQEFARTYHDKHIRHEEASINVVGIWLAVVETAGEIIAGKGAFLMLAPTHFGTVSELISNVETLGRGNELEYFPVNGDGSQQAERGIMVHPALIARLNIKRVIILNTEDSPNKSTDAVQVVAASTVASFLELSSRYVSIKP